MYPYTMTVAFIGVEDTQAPRRQRHREAGREETEADRY